MNEDTCSSLFCGQFRLVTGRSDCENSGGTGLSQVGVSLWKSLLTNAFFKNLFICFRQCCILVAVLRLSRGVASGAALGRSAWLLILAASVVAEHKLEACRLQWLWCTGLVQVGSSGPGSKLTPPSWAGGFLTT